MKHFRLWLLLLLAVLIPVRGALAVAMLCPPAGVGVQDEALVLDHRVGHEVAPVAPQTIAQVGSHDHAAHGHASGAVDDEGQPSSAQDKCNVCSAICSVTPLMSSALPLPVPQDLTATAFPDLYAPAPSFLSEGQERPPRSI